MKTHINTHTRALPKQTILAGCLWIITCGVAAHHDIIRWQGMSGKKRCQGTLENTKHIAICYSLHQLAGGEAGCPKFLVHLSYCSKFSISRIAPSCFGYRIAVSESALNCCLKTSWRFHQWDSRISQWDPVECTKVSRRMCEHRAQGFPSTGD